MRELALGLALTVLLASTSYSQESDCSPGLDQFQAIHEGMSYQKVVEILGCEGSMISSSELAGFKTEMYMWSGSGGFGANMNAMFQNGKMMMKAQFGLK